MPDPQSPLRKPLTEPDSPTSRAVFRTARKALLVGMLGLLSTGIWLGEVVLVKGWERLHWLQGYPWAAPVTALAPALGTLAAGSPLAKLSFRRVAVFLVVVWAVLWLSFEMCRLALIRLHATSHLPYVKGRRWSTWLFFPSRSC